MEHQLVTSLAMITGAASGTGASYAERLAKRGHDLVVVDRDQARLEEMAHALGKETGVGIEVMKADLTDKPDLLRVEHRLRGDSRIGLLVNNQGVEATARSSQGFKDQLRSMDARRSRASSRLSRTAVSGFAERGGGAIVDLFARQVTKSQQFNGALDGPRACLLSMILSIHRELSSQHVRIQAVLPAGTGTEPIKQEDPDLSDVPADAILEVGNLVDSALAGIENWRVITLPELHEMAIWDKFIAMRDRLRSRVGAMTR